MILTQTILISLLFSSRLNPCEKSGFMHEQPVFHKMGLLTNDSCPVAERLARRGFYVPSGLALSENQIAVVAQVLKEVLQ
jgi:dTDP-4-amino-4,6-dideoxygalactose transaminase